MTVTVALILSVGLFLPAMPAGAAQQVQIIDLGDSLQAVAAEALRDGRTQNLRVQVVERRGIFAVIALEIE